MKPTTRILLTAALAAFALGTGYSQAIWTSNHGDLGIGYDGTDIEPHWHLHPGAVVDGTALLTDGEYAPDELMPQIPFAKSTARSAGAQWDFVGVNSGDSVWVFPEVEDVELPFIGLGAEELDPADWSTPFTVTLTGISGSGVTAGGFFSLYTVDGFGDPTVKMASFGGISAADYTTIAAGAHAHYNWAFSEAGRYDVTFEISGTHAIEGAKSASATYSFTQVSYELGQKHVS